MRGLFSVCVVLAGSIVVQAQNTMEWTVDGEKRQARVVEPSKKSTAIPVMFVFHGHGGTMQNMERKGFQQHWPEALVVYPQGLPTATARDPEGTRAGWQPKPGDNKDRDLHFVDEMLKTLRAKYPIDENRIYATGHSNGGGFTYLLGATRHSVFAALAPSAAGLGSLRMAKDTKPLPMLHLAGEKDEIVPFANQHRSMDYIRKTNGCDAEGKEWAKVGKITATQYTSKTGPPFVAAIHPGTHQFPDEAPALIVQFFQAHSKKK